MSGEDLALDAITRSGWIGLSSPLTSKSSLSVANPAGARNTRPLKQSSKSSITLITVSLVSLNPSAA
eukprot:4117397-Prymnesium_polylepis.1